jgi:hypothetical protein
VRLRLRDRVSAVAAKGATVIASIVTTGTTVGGVEEAAHRNEDAAMDAARGDNGA